MIKPAMQDLLVLFSDPAAWLALATLVVMEVVLGIDNLIFISILTNKLPEHQRSKARRLGIGLAVILMLLAADPLARFIGNNPTIVMLALGFLLMIGAPLLADGIGVHVPKGYIYAAMAFSALIEGLNMLARRRKRKK